MIQSILPFVLLTLVKSITRTSVQFSSIAIDYMILLPFGHYN